MIGSLLFPQGAFFCSFCDKPCAIMSPYEDAEKALAAAQGNLHQKEKKMEQIESFIAEVEALPDCITEFRTDYWGHLVEKVTVHRKGAMTFTLSFGVEIEI